MCLYTKMIAKTLCFLLVLFYSHQAYGRSSQGDLLEWQDYDPDTIPDDAIPSGETMDNEDIYIGLVHFSNEKFEGFIPTNIVAGRKCVHIVVGLEDIEKICDNIKILVGKNDYLDKIYWEYARPSYFGSLFDSDDFRPVRAGWEVQSLSYNSSVYLGRQYFGGQNWVGKIYNSYPKEDENGVTVFSYEQYRSPDTVEIGKGALFEVLLFKY
ncbi:uncharacterized protein LOC126881265 [Diabrotica virgifera virgifera]|uniref:Uncharacterized protein LOC114345802 n=1 Tax=Diabrotica virgifera virgifera TaxID=50390 RepID=A0A6P7GRB1_DIAVI|nr:uncharacterized protein LOC126881265 [Diabrotica virgifera virgifera]